MGPESDTSIGIHSCARPYSLLATHTHGTMGISTCIWPWVHCCVWVCVCVCSRRLESRELMQAGLWQSSCPSARLIMQERHSRPPFILPGGEAVPACSPYHMALAPLLSLLSRSFSLPLSLYWGCCGWGWWWWRSREGGGEVMGGVVERHSTQHSLSFLSSTLFFFFLSSSLHFPFCGCEASEAEKRKREREREREGNRHPSLMQGDNNSLFFFYLPSEGPDDSSGRARWMKRRSVCVCVCVCVCVGQRGGGVGCVCVVVVGGGGGIPRDSPQISPGNCPTMSLRIREQPRPLLGSSGDGGCRRHRTVACLAVCTSTYTACAQWDLIRFTMCYVVSLQDEEPPVHVIVHSNMYSETCGAPCSLRV